MAYEIDPNHLKSWQRAGQVNPNLTLTLTLRPTLNLTLTLRPTLTLTLNLNLTPTLARRIWLSTSGRR